VSETQSFRIAVVILNYRTPELVVDCLRSVATEVQSDTDCVVVVDNASGDDSVRIIRQEIERSGWRHVRLIESPNNGGFAAGNNFGIRSVDAVAYLLLNSDTIVRAGAPRTLFEALQQAPDIGLSSPRLEWPDGEPQISCFKFHTPLSEIIGGSQTGPVRRLLARWDVPTAVAESVTEPEWTSFAAVMIRKEVIERVGGLDEGFFMYYEDVDYCRKARQHGFRIVNEPKAHIVHLRGGSSPVKALQRARKRRPRYYYASRSRYFRNAYGGLGPVMANACWTAGRAISLVRELCGNKIPHTVEREFVDNWRG
jgi:GT2 family glycosyltransferase